MDRRQFIKVGLSGLAGTAVSGAIDTPVFKVGRAVAAPLFGANSWSFGILGDTQWNQHESGDDGYSDHSKGPDGANPYSCPQSIIDQIDAKFVELGVKMVIQVGDLTDCGTTRGTKYRATIANTNLVANGIDFFTFRGNHETYGYSNGDSQILSENDYGVSAMEAAFPQMRNDTSAMVSGTAVTNFALASDSVGDDCLSYAFDYNNVRFLMLDFWGTGSVSSTAAGYTYGYTVEDQLEWIEDQLKNRTAEHCIVMAHQNLMGEDHQDCPFSGYTNANTDVQNSFYALLNKYNVQYYIGGHDHIHQRSRVASPDGASVVEELICQSCSNKFYTPSDVDNEKWYDQKDRETSMSQEMYCVGFYVVTVEDSVLMIDYYADDGGNLQSSSNYPDGSGSLVTPTFNFEKKETWGYSFNDDGVTSFTIDEGSSYTINTKNTTAKIIKTGGTAKDYQGRSLEKHAEAWYAKKSTVSGAASDIITFAGISSGAIPVEGYEDTDNQNDPACVQLSYSGFTANVTESGSSLLLCRRNDSGEWVNAVEGNFGGTTTFVNGPYKESYELGTYGIDTDNKVAWAVVNTDGQFAVINSKYSPWTLFLPAVLSGKKKK